MKVGFTLHYDFSTGTITPTRQCPWDMFRRIGSEDCMHCPYNRGLFQDNAVDCERARRSDVKVLKQWEQYEQQINFLKNESK